jgi:hypothetical protein
MLGLQSRKYFYNRTRVSNINCGFKNETFGEFAPVYKKVKVGTKFR